MQKITTYVIPETAITFTNSPVSGHDHDGVESALIDTSKYSIFDFSPSFTESYDKARRSQQQTNSDSIKTFIVNVIKNSIIGDDIAELQANGGGGGGGESGSSVVVTKGDLLTRDNSGLANLSLGYNNYVLTVDTTTSTGLSWKPTAEAGTSVQDGRNLKYMLMMEINP